MITPLDSSSQIEIISFGTDFNGGLIPFTNDQTLKIWGHISRNKIIIQLMDAPSYSFSDNFDGVYYPSTKNYLIQVRGLEGNYIPDTCIQVIGERVSTDYSNDIFSFDSKDSMVIFRSEGYYDLEIQLPDNEESANRLLIFAYLKPIIDIATDDKIQFTYNKKKGIAILNDIKFKVEIE